MKIELHYFKSMKGKIGIPIFLSSLSLIFLMLIYPMGAFAQKQTVTGTVTGASENEPLPGVNIVVKGMTYGTITDVNGHYQIEVEPGAVLVASFIGFENMEKEVGNQNVINFELEEALTDLDEVVVIGYGVQKKKLVTGATAQIDGDELEKRNVTSAMQALQGQAAGVNITSTSGQPGEGMKVVVRGVGTISGAEPLYIVDGMLTGDIDYLNPADIESIDILKDAASAAIYGSRGANGVVLVTTKQGKVGKTQVTFDAYTGVQNLAKKIDLLDAREYAMIMNEQHLNSGGSASNMPFSVNDLPRYTNNEVANTNWIDEMFVNNALTQNYVAGATGGNEQTVYSLSLSYTGQEGIVGGKDHSNLERYTARFNSTNHLYDGRVVIGEHLTYSHTKTRGIDVGNQYNNHLRGAFNASPLLPVYDNNGDFFNTADTSVHDQNGENYWNNAEANPYAGMVYGSQNVNNYQKLIGDIFTEINLMPNLKFRSSIALEVYTEEGREYLPIYQSSIYSFREYNEASQNLTINKKIKNDNLITYNKITGLHRFEAMVGQSSELNSGQWMFTRNADVGFNDLDHAFIDNTTNVEDSKFSMNGGPGGNDRVLSYFGRVQYNFDETYLLNVTFRADGSSKFAEGNRWGYFPSVSAGWVVTNEPFLSAPFLQFFKLRASWGQNGNNNAESHTYLAPIKFTQAKYAFGSEEGVSTPGAYPERLSNPGLRWETAEQTDIGFDARLFNSALSVNFDWYHKVTKDWLIKAPIYATAGADAPFINGGQVTNTGVELVLSYHGNAGNLKYSVSANGAYNKNEVGKIPTDDGVIHGATNTLYANSEEFYRAETGYPISYFWGWETNGIFQSTTDITNYTSSDGTIIQPKAQPGDIKYVDQNDDGKIDDNDKTNLGDPNPDLIYGLNINLTYKGFDFGVILNGVTGNQLVQSYREHTNKYSNYTSEILGRWTGPNTSNTIPRVTNANKNYQFSDIFVKPGGYARISNVTLGYDIATITDAKFLSQCRVYAQVQNLATFTKYSGMDPEVGFGFDNGETDKFSSGIDLGYYPKPRTIMLGVNVKF